MTDKPMTAKEAEQRRIEWLARLDEAIKRRLEPLPAKLAKVLERDKP